MLVLLQGIINSLDNELKLSRIECFSSPSITFPHFPPLYRCSPTRPAKILFCLCALRTYWSQRGMNCIPRAFFSFVEKKTNKSKMPALLSPCWGLGHDRNHGFTWGEDNTVEMEPCFCYIKTDYEGNCSERPPEPLMSL